MTLPRTVADVLSEHVSFEVECIDRIINVYVPQLQYATGLVSYIHHQLGKPVASTAALAPVSEAFTRSSSQRPDLGMIGPGDAWWCGSGDEDFAPVPVEVFQAGSLGALGQ